MGQPESVLASHTHTTMFVPPLANRMLLSSQSSHLIQLQVAAAVDDVAIVPSSSSSSMETPSIQHYNAGAGAENNDPNQTANLKSSLELTNTDGVVALASVIPNGFAVVDNEMFEGKKIIATRTFKKGELLYVGQARMLDLSAIGHGFKLKIYSEDCELLSEHCNNDTHSVDDYAAASKTGSESKRQVYGWDGFMNHSCDANAYFPLLYRTPDEMYYRAIAMRDIKPGEEVTCDYALFDYHCNGHEIEVCACGSHKCRGKMLGFQGLTLQEKVNILHQAEEEIKDKFLKEENVVIYKSNLPSGIGLVTSEDSEEGGNHLFATDRFEIGQTLFTNSAELIPQEELHSKKFVLDIDGRYILLDNEQHFIYREGYAEMLGFDSFMDHSCAPTAEQEYINKYEYVVRAKKVILPGDKITCDYMALDNRAVDLKNIGKSSFVCKCGESNCKGVLVC